MRSAFGTVYFGSVQFGLAWFDFDWIVVRSVIHRMKVFQPSKWRSSFGSINVSTIDHLLSTLS